MNLIETINDAISQSEADLASLPETTPMTLMQMHKRTALDRAVDHEAERLKAKIATLKQAQQIAKEHAPRTDDPAEILGILDSAIMHSGAMDSPYEIGRRDAIAGRVDALEALSGRTGYRFTEYKKTVTRIGS